MSRENTSSVDMANGKKLAHYAKQELVAAKAQFQPKGTEVADQVINARKLSTLTVAKAKAKRKAKLAKVSRKKNKR